MTPPRAAEHMTQEIAEDRLRERLRDAYGLSVAALKRLPGGGDPTRMAYRVELGDGSACFLEVKSNPFDEIAAGIALPRFLADLGLPQVVAPIPDLTGRPSVRLDSLHLVLFPFVEGRNAFDRPLSEDQWIELGSVMKVVHSAAPSQELRWHLPVEAFAPAARIRARHHLGEAGSESGGGAAAELAAFLDSRKAEIGRIVDRAEALAEVLRRRSPNLVICHGAIHAGNVLVADDGDVFLVGWDAPLLAPKERDLMYIGGGVGGAWNRREEEAAFYLAYGPAEVDAAALAYYRYERIIGDIAATADALLLAGADGGDRNPAVERLLGQFGGGGAVEIADRTYDGLGAVAG